MFWTISKPFGFFRIIFHLPDNYNPVLKIEFGPRHADFGFVWSPQKARKYHHMQQMIKMGILCQCQFDTLIFQVQIQFCRPLRGAYD